jgi:outer membrane lipoprotein-sorting protein
MRKWIMTTLAILVVALPVAADELADVLAKSYEARGGLEKIKSVDSVRITGTMTMGGGQMSAPFTWEWKRPDKLRMEFSLQGMTGIQAYDGTVGWAVMPFTGSTEPQKMPAEEVDQLKEQADFEGELVDWEAKGYQVELLGKENIEGTDAYAIRLTRPSGDVSTIYLDDEYYLEFKRTGKRNVRGQEIEFETSTGDYKEVDGLIIPFSMEVQAVGMPMSQTITFEKVELNPPIDDSRFSMPAGDTGKPAGDQSE